MLRFTLHAEWQRMLGVYWSVLRVYVLENTLRAYSNIISYIMSIYARIYSEYVRVFSEYIQNMPVCTQSVLRVFSKHTQREYVNIFEIYLECTLLTVIS